MSDAAGLELLASLRRRRQDGGTNPGDCASTGRGAPLRRTSSPDGILDAYLASIEHDEAQLVNLREQGQRSRQAERLKT